MQWLYRREFTRRPKLIRHNDNPFDLHAGILDLEVDLHALPARFILPIVGRLGVRERRALRPLAALLELLDSWRQHRSFSSTGVMVAQNLGKICE